MNTIGLVYFSNTGNTKALAEAFRSAVEAKGGSLYFSEAAGADKAAWKLDMEGRGAVIAAEPVTCLEAPDGEAEDAMKKAAESLLG